jgi:hypothetical protein
VDDGCGPGKGFAGALRTAFSDRAEAESLMRQAALDPVVFHWVNEMSWTAIGTKPFA